MEIATRISICLLILQTSCIIGVSSYEYCDGIPCVCFDGLGCFLNRAECEEDRTSLLPESPDKIKTKFLLYTPSVQRVEITYDMTAHDFVNAGYKSALETKFVIHGFINSADSVGIEVVRDAFLTTGNYNIVMVDWECGADIGLGDLVLFWTIYRQASQNTRIVAKQLHLLLEQLHNEVQLQYDDVHLIGHSLGAQTAGMAAAYLSGQVGRISGLDPAKPNFEGKNKVCRLDENDANFVDIIHSDIEKFGTNEQCGDIDFWPHDGKPQPGCVLIGCSHGRCLEYFAFSIKGICPYTSQPCDNTSCSDCPMMGINADKTSARGNYCLYPKENKPYC